MQITHSLSKILSSSMVAAAALTAAVGAQAQPNSNYSLYAPNSSYVGVNIGKSDFSLGNGIGLYPSDQRDTSYNIYTGSYFNPNFGIEVGYTHFGEVARAGGKTKAQGVNLSLVGKFPLTSSFNILGKIGTTYGRTDTSTNFLSGVASGNESGFGLSYGAGVEYAFNPQLSAVLQYDEHNMKFAGSGRERISATSVGLRYRF